MAVGPSFELGASEAVLRELDRALASAPRKAQRAAERTLRRTVRAGKSAARREIRQTINLKKKLVDQRIGTTYRRSNLTGQVRIRDRRIGLIEFMTPAQIARAWRAQVARRSKGVTVKPFKNQGRQLYPGAFVQIVRSGKWLVFRRTSRCCVTSYADSAVLNRQPSAGGRNGFTRALH